MVPVIVYEPERCYFDFIARLMITLYGMCDILTNYTSADAFLTFFSSALDLLTIILD